MVFFDMPPAAWRQRRVLIARLSRMTCRPPVARLCSGMSYGAGMSSEAAIGILSAEQIRASLADGAIRIERPLDVDQVQPASLDLRLGSVAYRVRASFLPGPTVLVKDRLAELTLHEIDLTNGSVLETGCVYIVPLLESL